LLIFTSSSYAGKYDAQIDMVIQMITSSNEFKTSAQCIGITQNQAEVAYRKVMTACMEKYGNNDDNIDIQNKCIEIGAKKELNLTPEIIKKCTVDDENSSDKINEPEEDDMSEESLAAQQQAGKEQLQAMLDMVQKQSAGTEKSITLPIYPNAQLMANHKFMILSGKKTLPVAMFSTPDDIKKVVEYYKKNLATFNRHFKMDTYEFAEKLPPETLDFNSYNEAFYFMPSVTIYQISNNVPVTIQIVYKK